MTVLACIVGHVPLSAQAIEVAPFAGYRFGNDFFEIATGQRIDLDGAPAVGVVLNLPLSNGLQFEGLFTHQEADVLVPLGPFGAPARWRVAVDHWQGGGLQEFIGGNARPFLTGTLGLTRYAAEADNEIRFTIGAGGGVKLFPIAHVGVRLDGRVYATLNDAGSSAVACAAGTCLLGLNLHVIWQAEFTAGITVKLP